MAGGKGARLAPLSDTTAKLLLPLANKPLIDYLINHLKKNGCDNVIICTGHLGDKIKDYLNKKDYGLQIKLSMEEKPLGTGGALNLIKNQLKKEFFVLYGDVYTTINLGKMLDFHKKKRAIVTAAIHPSSHPKDSDLVEFNSDARITKILRKPHTQIPENPHNLAALYLVSRDVKKYLLTKTPYDFEHDLLTKLVDENVPVYGYNTSEVIMDIGTPERLEEAERLLRI